MIMLDSLTTTMNNITPASTQQHMTVQLRPAVATSQPVLTYQQLRVYQVGLLRMFCLFIHFIYTLQTD